MPRGQRPTSNLIKLVTGNPGRRPLTRASKIPPGIPKAPAMLTGAALAEWKRLTPLLAEAGLVTLLDRGLIAAYCIAWARWEQAERYLKRGKGLVVKTPNGYPVQSPYLAAANKAMEQVQKLSEQIGLTASSRARLKATGPKPPDDPGEAFFKGKGA